LPICTIIGVGPGLSQAIAERFVAGGYGVGLIARSETTTRPLAERLSESGTAVWARADAGDEICLRDALEAVEQQIGPTDVLIYNASVMRAEGALNVRPAMVRAEFDVTVIGALVSAQHVARGMIERGSGAILFTGGGLALEPYPEWTSLALGKAALRSLAFSLYKELAPEGVHVAVVAVCGIVEPHGPFDPHAIAEEYWRLATKPNGVHDREAIIQPPGTDPHYNDPERRHRTTTLPPIHLHDGKVS
jgi:NAD(P)-dependent dehydrogenase (short-subunit alcohol dehydrogenase family)